VMSSDGRLYVKWSLQQAGRGFAVSPEPSAGSTVSGVNSQGNRHPPAFFGSPPRGREKRLAEVTNQGQRTLA
jgi:hypothetical protein